MQSQGNECSCLFEQSAVILVAVMVSLPLFLSFVGLYIAYLNKIQSKNLFLIMYQNGFPELSCDYNCTKCRNDKVSISC